MIITSLGWGDTWEILNQLLVVDPFLCSFQNFRICCRCFSPNLCFIFFVRCINSSTKWLISAWSFVLNCTEKYELGSEIKTDLRWERCPFQFVRRATQWTENYCGWVMFSSHLLRNCKRKEIDVWTSVTQTQTPRNRRVNYSNANVSFHLRLGLHFTRVNQDNANTETI